MRRRDHRARPSGGEPRVRCGLRAPVTIEKTEAGRYDATRVGGHGVTFFDFLVLD